MKTLRIILAAAALTVATEAQADHEAPSTLLLWRLRQVEALESAHQPQQLERGRQVSKARAWRLFRRDALLLELSRENRRRNRKR